MIYVKVPIDEHSVIEIGITRDNTFTRCLKCGREMKIDLSGFADEEEFDMTKFEMLCEKCSLDLVRRLEAGKPGKT